MWWTHEEGFELAGEGVQEEVAQGIVCSDEEGFAVIAEFEFRPVARGTIGSDGGGHNGGQVVEGAEVEGREGGFIVVS